jgi:hypothetical protein
VGWRAGNAEDGKAALDVWRSGGEWQFTWKTLHVIVTPPSAIRRMELRRGGPRLRVA